MTNINRDYLVVIDVKSGNITSPNMYFYNTDKATSNIYVQLVVKETIVNATPIETASDYSVVAKIIKPGKVLKELTGVLVNEAEAIYEFDLPADFTNLSGKYDVEFWVSAKVSDKDEMITSSSTKYTVKKSKLTDLDPSIDDKDDYPLLIALKEELEQLKNSGQLGHGHDNKDILDGITTNKVSSWDNKSDFSGSYNDLTEKPTIPTKTSDLTNDSDFATNASVDSKIANINTGEIVNLEDYQKKTDDTLKTNNKTIIGAINELYDLLKAIIGGETNGIVNTSYDETTGNLVLTASNGATITYNEATGNLSITNSSTTYDSATGNINIK